MRAVGESVVVYVEKETELETGEQGGREGKV